MDLRDYIAVSEDSPSGLVWIRKASKKLVVGSPAMNANSGSGYKHGRFNGAPYRAHRVVFYLTHGYWPVQVDHIDGNRHNNAPHNLRAVTCGENNQNRIAAGYSWCKGKYAAQIIAGGKYQYLGRFSTEAEARTAYLSAKKQAHPTAPGRCYV